jgi:RHS repeat-associated protein
MSDMQRQSNDVMDETGNSSAIDWIWQRWYDTTEGRWLSQDPSGLSPDVNMSRYVGNDPLNQADPTGLAAYPFNNSKWFALPEDNIVSETVGPTEFGSSGVFNFQFFASSSMKDELEATVVYKPGPNSPPASTLKFVEVVRESEQSPVNNLMTPMSPRQVSQFQNMESAAKVMIGDRTSNSYGWGVDRYWGLGVRNPTIFFDNQAPGRISSATGKPVMPQTGQTDATGKMTRPAIMMNVPSIIGSGPHVLDYIIGIYSQCAAGDGWLGFVRWGAGDDNRLLNTRYAYVGTQMDSAPPEFTDALKAFLNKHPDRTIKLP